MKMTGRWSCKCSIRTLPDPTYNLSGVPLGIFTSAENCGSGTCALAGAPDTSIHTRTVTHPANALLIARNAPSGTTTLVARTSTRMRTGTAFRMRARSPSRHVHPLDDWPDAATRTANPERLQGAPPRADAAPCSRLSRPSLCPRSSADVILGSGGMAEWTIAAVLKTARGRPLGSSNLPPSATRPAAPDCTRLPDPASGLGFGPSYGCTSLPAY